jgi:hypothetical protein
VNLYEIVGNSTNGALPGQYNWYLDVNNQVIYRNEFHYESTYNDGVTMLVESNVAHGYDSFFLKLRMR